MVDRATHADLMRVMKQCAENRNLFKRILEASDNEQVGAFMKEQLIITDKFIADINGMIEILDEEPVAPEERIDVKAQPHLLDMYSNTASPLLEMVGQRLTETVKTYTTVIGDPYRGNLAFEETLRSHLASFTEAQAEWARLAPTS